MRRPEIWYDGNSHFLLLEGLSDEAARLRGESSYVNDASVALTIYEEEDGQSIPGSWPMAGVYVTGSNGDYMVALPHTVEVALGVRYRIKVTATKGSLRGEWDGPLHVRRRLE